MDGIVQTNPVQTAPQTVQGAFAVIADIVQPQFPNGVWMSLYNDPHALVPLVGMMAFVPGCMLAVIPVEMAIHLRPIIQEQERRHRELLEKAMREKADLDALGRRG